MTDQLNCPQPTLQAGAVLHGFKVLRVEMLPGVRITAYEIEHEKTGARVLHLHSNDRENLYAIGFRTPPADSTGLPHILEHSVLAGSEKYPLKDVFKELMRSTLQTFINAFTYPDKTVYPVSSQIKEDFFNLARVYTDLVLHPRLLKQTFLQEGHHLEFNIPDDLTSGLTVSGIVYNEMKGVYSSPDSLAYKVIQEGLYPDSIYAFDSGGDPDVIPTLKYEQFYEFHKTFYSPSNARFFLYGDIPTIEHLEFLAEMLAGFERVEVDSSIKSQQVLTKPRIIRSTYPVQKNEPCARKTSVNVAWMLSENTDYENSLLLEIISGLLVGSSASPLRKALIDSGLGEDLTPVSGIECDLKQLSFSVGLRNTDSAEASNIEKLIFSTLEDIVSKGYDIELIEGIIHQIEYHGKEIVRGAYPYGIALMSNVFQTWLYDGDPLISLDFPVIIERIRKLWAGDPQLFQKKTKSWLIDNNHRILTIMEPDPDFSEKKEKAYREKMDKLQASFSAAQLAEINEQARQLKIFQSEPDSPEAAATIPKLNISAIPRKVETIPTLEIALEGLRALEHEIFTNGIVYFDLVFDTSHIPEDLQQYLPLLGKIISGMGAAGLSYDELAKRIALKMGGFGYDLSAGLSAYSCSCWQKMTISGSSLYRNLPDALNIVSDILCAGDLEDKARMYDLITERKNNLQSAIVPSGHIFARRAAGAALTLPAYRDEQWNGRKQLRFVQTVARDFTSLKEELVEKLQQLKAILFNRNNLLINVTAENNGLKLFENSITGLLNKLPEASPNQKQSPPLLPQAQAGIAVPSQVSYVARVLAAPAYVDPASAMLMVAARELSNSYLYKYIRVQGGAYGGMSSYDPSLGLFSFLSYRDPHLAETLKVFEDAEIFFSQNEISPEDMEKAIISTIGMLDRPLDPGGRGHVALMRNIAGITDEMRQQFRNEILSATPQKLKNTLREYFSRSSKSAATAVYSSQEKIDEANTSLKEKLLLEHIFED
ncbi:MAG: insulinase family protein [Smithella sp.]